MGQRIVAEVLAPDIAILILAFVLCSITFNWHYMLLVIAAAWFFLYAVFTYVHLNNFRKKWEISLGSLLDSLFASLNHSGSL
jgi:hypothetical protein